MDTAVATITFGLLYGLALVVPVPPLQIPGYLLLVGASVMGGLPGSSGGLYPLLFGLYLLSLGLVAGAVSAVLRLWTPSERATWRPGVASALGLIGGFSLAFAMAILAGSSQLEPVFTTGIAGVVLLIAAAWIVRPTGGPTTR